MDEIYDGWEAALGESLTARLSGLLEDLSRGALHPLPTYDWSAGAFNSYREIPPSDVLILEGVGSAQRVVREFATATIWLDIDPATGLTRVLERDGNMSEPYMSQWQINEDKHHHREKTRENADFVLSTIPFS
jgi:uridine kinase